VSFRSNHASGLHGFSFLYLQREIAKAGFRGTIQAQIVDEKRQQQQQIEESYRFPAETTWRVNLNRNAQTRTHLIDSSNSGKVFTQLSAGDCVRDCAEGPQ
jgi:hypothetical protein